MPDLQRCSPLHADARLFSAAGFQLRELDAVTKLRVQVLRPRGIRTPAVDPAYLPERPNTTSGVDPIALWKAPDDWLVYSQTLASDALSDWLTSVHSEAPLVITDVSSASVVLELRGPRALDILLRDCTLDLEGDAIPPDACGQTQFAQTTVMIHRPVSAETWRLFVERSVAMHVREWLVDTAIATTG
jgi:heterotetrameric sarcosine oxidase gamma subunit